MQVQNHGSTTMQHTNNHCLHVVYIYTEKIDGECQTYCQIIIKDFLPDYVLLPNFICYHLQEAVPKRVNIATIPASAVKNKTYVVS